MKMMNSINFAILTLGAAALLGGCPQTGTTGGTTTGLATVDEAAISAAIDAIESLSSSVNTSQGTLSTDSQSSLESSSTCPAIEFSGSNTQGLNLSVSVDFGSGCSVTGFDDLTCAGSASGTLTTSTLSLTFDTLSCDSASIDGDANFTFTRSDTTITLDGTWDLTGSKGSQQVGVTGTGEASFDRTAKATTVGTFTGSITDGTQTYGCELDDTVTSFLANGNFIPQSGRMTLSGATIKSMVITFNANSPATGDVQVSINGGTAFTYNLFD